MTSRLCLNMIVKDEEAIIERALRAAAPHLACYVICDTGSTDRTVEIIEQVMAEYGVPGQVVRTSFANFGQARNEALEAARASSFDFDYLLFCDADMELVVAEGGLDVELTEPVYSLMQYTVNGDLGYGNARLLKHGVPGQYVGVTHEFLSAGTLPHPVLKSAHYIDHAAGSSRVDKFRRDVALLLQGLESEPENSRYVFYLAQSYRDAGDHNLSIKQYERRIELGGWAEEVWYSRLQIALLLERTDRRRELVVEAHLTAYQERPTRAEPLAYLARYHRQREEYALAHLFAAQAITIPRPDDILFVDEGVYRWRALDEFSIACYWIGRYADGVRACEQLLASGQVPEEQRERVEKNLAFNQQGRG